MAPVELPPPRGSSAAGPPACSPLLASGDGAGGILRPYCATLSRIHGTRVRRCGAGGRPTALSLGLPHLRVLVIILSPCLEY